MALSKLNYNSLNLTPVAGNGIGFDSGADDLEASFSGNSMVFIKKLTASTSDDLSFVNGSSDVVLDNTYKEYLFIFKDIHPATDGTEFTFQGSVDTGSNYGVAITSTAFIAEKPEADSGGSLSYQTSRDLAQSTGFQHFGVDIGSDNDHCSSGYLHLFNPSSTTFVKHFVGTLQQAHQNDLSLVLNVAGYFNTTSAIDAIQFKMAANSIDAGDICLYGIL